VSLNKPRSNELNKCGNHCIATFGRPQLLSSL